MIPEENLAFLPHLTKRFEEIQGKDSLAVLREAAWEKFTAMGLPQSKDDAFRYVPLRDLYAALSRACKNTEEHAPLDSAHIAHAVLPECRHSYVVFVDGVFCPHLSDTSALSSDILLIPLSQAMRSHGLFLRSHGLKMLKEEKDPFTLLNLALHNEGLFLYVPPKKTVSCPIQCVQVITQQAHCFSASRIQIVLGGHSSCQWISTHLNLETVNPHCAAPAIDLFLDEGAQADLIGDLSPSPAHWCFDTIRGYLKRDSLLKTLNVIGGSKTTRHNIYVQCAGENSEVDLKGVWMLKESMQAHAFVTVEHLAPKTRSMQLFKGILLDASRSSFEGKILVRQAAQKTEAYQLNNNLIIGKAAIAQSKPNLEIFADDVKASHGATVARPDETQLFYLKSRGLEEETAKKLLINGFYRDILDQIPYVDMRKKFLSTCTSEQER